MLEEQERVIEQKHCVKCSVSKPVFDFSTVPSKKDGYYAYCKSCANEIQRDRYKNNTNGHRDKDNAASTKRHYKIKYGLAEEVIKEIMLNRQGNCAICKEKTNLVIDHCHATGKVRGRICGLCNTMLGHARDNINYLKAAINYLQESKK